MTRLLAALVLVLSAAAPAIGAPTPASFTTKGVDIHYTTDGSGPAVVLLHGFTGSGARHFGGTGVIQAVVDAGFQAIAIDLRGHGMSSKPLGAAAYGLRMVDDVVALMDHLKIRRAHVVGYSMGGWIASQMMVRHAGRVLTTTLLGSGWEGDDVTATTQRMQTLADGFDRKDASALIGAVTAGAQNAPSDADVAAVTADLFARNPPEVLAVMARAMTPLFQVRRSDLRRTKIPVFAVVGEHDQPNVESARRLEGVVPRFEMVVIPGTTHQTSVRPAAALIAAFLTKHRLDR